MTSNMQTSPAMSPNMWTLLVMTSNMRTSPDITPNVELKPVMTVCSYSYHFTYAFQRESSLYSCINFHEILAWNRHDLWILSHRNGIRTHNHLVRKQTLNHLARLAYKWLWVVLWVRIPFQLPVMTANMRISPLMNSNIGILLVIDLNIWFSPVMDLNIQILSVLSPIMQISPVLSKFELF